MFGALVWIAKVALNVIGKVSGDAALVATAEIEGATERARFAMMIRTATAGFWEMRLITAVIAGCFTLHLVAVTLDTVFRFGWKVAAYPYPFNEWQGVILLSFFGVQLAARGLSTLAAVFLGRK